MDSILSAAELGDIASLKANWTNDMVAALARNPSDYANLLNRACRHPSSLAWVLANTVAAIEPPPKRPAEQNGFTNGLQLWNDQLNGRIEKPRMSSVSEMKTPEDEAAVIKRVEDALEVYKKGEFLVVFDAKDRENEGDLIIAAEFCTPDKVAFMIRHCSGLICTPCNSVRLKELNLPLMVKENDHSEYHGTAFTISMDLHHKHGTTTGISAEDRSKSIIALAQPSKYGKDDFVRPGHVFPLRSRDGGVLVRGGHTEAGTDLCMLAGLYPAAAICEINKLDGSMARYRDLEVFAQMYNLTLISIEDIVAYRKITEARKAK